MENQCSPILSIVPNWGRVYRLRVARWQGRKYEGEITWQSQQYMTSRRRRL